MHYTFPPAQKNLNRMRDLRSKLGEINSVLEDLHYNYDSQTGKLQAPSIIMVMIGS